MKTLVRKIDRLSNRFYKFQSYFLVFILASLCLNLIAQIVWRYVFHSPIIWSEELARYMFVWISLVGASWAGYHHYHVQMTQVINKFPDNIRHIQQICISLICTILCIMLIKPACILCVAQSRIIASTLGVSLAVEFLAAPIGLIILTIQQALDTLLAIFDWQGYKAKYFTNG